MSTVIGANTIQKCLTKHQRIYKDCLFGGSYGTVASWGFLSKRQAREHRYIRISELSLAWNNINSIVRVNTSITLDEFNANFLVAIARKMSEALKVGPNNLREINNQSVTKAFSK